jgi:hypothetical protein
MMRYLPRTTICIGCCLDYLKAHQRLFQAQHYLSKAVWIYTVEVSPIPKAESDHSRLPKRMLPRTRTYSPDISHWRYPKTCLTHSSFPTRFSLDKIGTISTAFRPNADGSTWTRCRQGSGYHLPPSFLLCFTTYKVSWQDPRSSCDISLCRSRPREARIRRADMVVCPSYPRSYSGRLGKWKVR